MRWYVPQGARGSRALGLGRAGARVGVRRRLRAGLYGRAVGITEGAGRGGPVDAGPGAAAIMSEPAPEVPEDLFREVKYYAVGDIDPQVRPVRGPSAGPSPLRCSRALQDLGPEPRGTPGREGPLEGPREHRPGAAAGRASCGAL